MHHFPNDESGGVGERVSGSAAFHCMNLRILSGVPRAAFLPHQR